MSSPEPDPEGRDARAEEDAWREIVAHYGERPDVPELPPVVERPHPQPEASTGWTAQPRDRDDPPEERYVPPAVPRAPLPRGPRALAWLGLFGPPVVMLLFIVLGLSMPGWGVFLLFVAFVSGFGYLVATMRKRDDSDPWDDGAVV
jgi:hypothetical protein